MDFLRNMVALGLRTGAAAAVAAVMVGLLSAPATAQTPPFSAYGSGLQPGDTVVALVDGVACGEVTADEDGNWLLPVAETAECSPTEGAEITFTLNGDPTDATATYTPGGAPADVAAGIDLVAPAGDGDGGVDGGAVSPAPADTGNAGLTRASGAPALLVIGLAAATVALVVGARLRRRGI